MITKNTTLREIEHLSHPCRCNVCEVGCKHSSGFLVDKDKKKIAEFLGISEKELEEKYLEKGQLLNKEMLRPKILRNEKGFGKCIFFSEKKGCNIHEVKPLQCKLSMGCKSYGEDINKWFIVKYALDEKDKESIKQYEIYLKFNKELPEK